MSDVIKPPPTANPALEIVHSPSLYQAVAERLRLMILENMLAPGSRISEKHLCETFGVSRTPLREALKVLANEGLIELLPNRGAHVTEIDPQEVSDLFDVMAVLEGLSGSLLADRASNEEIAEIQSIHNQMVACYQNQERSEYFRLNQHIHHRLTEISGNRVLHKLAPSLMTKVTRARYAANMQLERWEQSVEEHELILQALKKRDGPALSAIMSLHMQKTGDAVRQRLQPN
ncbi:GntR family transcriptional regulator [Halomonas halocynthiae]|uniref:GntR family transcriptional regulator n=1 Tax=Halomonas halocynthiae TaxID=176290 RepID=UPI000427F288|nr:GntR family transcriptional regulator [Halomonas halocynthiae]